MIDACESGPVAVLGARCGLVGCEDVEGEAAQTGEHAGIGSDARAVLAKGDVAAVMGGILDTPMAADGIGGSLGGERDIGGVERGLAGTAEQASGGIAGVDLTLDTDDGGDMVLPAGVGQPVAGVEDGDGAALVAIAALVAAADSAEWRGGGSDGLAVLEQGGLVVLDLDDQRDVGLCRDFEMFF